MTESGTATFPPASAFLRLPLEIRRIIYTHLLQSPIPIFITPSPTPDPTTRPTINPHPLTSQLLSTSHLIHTEAHPLLYTLNTFDLTHRSALPLLLTHFPAQNFTLLTHLLLDWDQLQDFSFQLAKPTFRDLLTSLSTIETRHYRTRVSSDHAAFLWRDVKSYERAIVTSSLAIVEKCPLLIIVVQSEWSRPQRSRGQEIARRNAERAARQAEEAAFLAVDAANAASAAGDTASENTTNFDNEGNQSGVPAASSPPPPPAAPPSAQHSPPPSQPSERRSSATTTRVKWRFLASPAQMLPNETEVDIRAEVAIFTAKGPKGEQAEDEGARQMALDPI